MRVNTLTLLLTLCAIAPPPAHPQAETSGGGLQPLAAVQRAAEAGLRAQLDANLSAVTLAAQPLDPRLRLARCALPLEAGATPPRGSQARALVRVSCRATPAWSVNVPVEIHRKTPVLVLRRAVARGEALSAADVSVQTRRLPGLASPYLGSVAELANRRTRRPLPAGAALAADALDAALLIRRGELVTLAADASGIEVRAPGRAMADATARQRVRVQNLYSLKIVEGVADSSGVVRVTP